MGLSRESDQARFNAFNLIANGYGYDRGGRRGVNRTVGHPTTSVENTDFEISEAIETSAYGHRGDKRHLETAVPQQRRYEPVR
jgi:hypothetical protein